MIFFLVIAAVIIGALMPVQAGINAELSRIVNHPYLGAFVSFLIGTVALTALILIQGLPVADLKRLSGASPIHFVGGMLGALFVGSSIFLIPKMGATAMIASFITGQLLMSVLMDHFGWFGVPVTPMNGVKAIGIVLLFTGLYLVMRKTA